MASLYQKCLQDLCGYIYAQIKMIEFAEEPTEVRRSPDELQIGMVQQIAWQLGYRFEPKSEDDREPLPACKDRRTVASRRSRPAQPVVDGSHVDQRTVGCRLRLFPRS